MNRGQWLALAGTVVIVVVVLAASGSPPFGSGSRQTATERYEAPLGSVRAIDATIRMGAGRLSIRTIDTRNAYEAVLTHSGDVRVEVVYDAGRLRVEEVRALPVGRTTNDWEIGITRAVPVTLVVSTGAGRSTLNLTGLSGSVTITTGAGEVDVAFDAGNGALDRLELAAGAGRFSATGLGNAHARTVVARAGIGELRLDFSGSATGTTVVTVNGGVGRLALDIPRDVGVRLRLRAGLGRRPSLEGFTQIGEHEYTDAGWSGPGPKLDLAVALGVGGFDLRRR